MQTTVVILKVSRKKGLASRGYFWYPFIEGQICLNHRPSSIKVATNFDKYTTDYLDDIYQLHRSLQLSAEVALDFIFGGLKQVKAALSPFLFLCLCFFFGVISDKDRGVLVGPMPPTSQSHNFTSQKNQIALRLSMVKALNGIHDPM